MRLAKKEAIAKGLILDSYDQGAPRLMHTRYAGDGPTWTTDFIIKPERRPEAMRSPFIEDFTVWIKDVTGKTTSAAGFRAIDSPMSSTHFTRRRAAPIFPDGIPALSAASVGWPDATLLCITPTGILNSGMSTLLTTNRGSFANALTGEWVLRDQRLTNRVNVTLATSLCFNADGTFSHSPVAEGIWPNWYATNYVIFFNMENPRYSIFAKDRHPMAEDQGLFGDVSVERDITDTTPTDVLKLGADYLWAGEPSGTYIRKKDVRR